MIRMIFVTLFHTDTLLNTPKLQHMNAPDQNEDRILCDDGK